MKRGKKLLLYGMAALMASQIPAMPVSAAQAGEILQETVEAQTYEAVTATSGDFGVNNGLHWEYDTVTKTVTVSGEDMPNVSWKFTEDWIPFNSVFPAETEKFCFENCTISSNMSYFFSCLFCLREIDFAGLEINNLTSTRRMFSSCASLTSLDLRGLDTSDVTDMVDMFSYCSSLSSINMCGLDTGNVLQMGYMFAGCRNLRSIDLSGFDTGSLISMKYMFGGCDSLATLTTPSKMGDVTADLPATFYTADGTSTTALSKDFAGTTLYKEGHVPQPATPLAITTQPVSAEVKDGSQAIFTVSATGDGLTYQWQLCYAGDDTFRNCTFSGADTATLTVDATKARNGYSFRCVVTDERGNSITSDVAKLTIKSDVALGVALTASKTTADPGESVTFTAVGNGGDGNYQYKFIINDTTNDKWYKIQDYSAKNTIEWTATTAGTKRIMVDIKDGNCKSVGKNISVVVNGVPELSATFTASSYEVNPGDVVTLTANGLGGNGKYNYKFIINDKTDDKWYRLQDYRTNSVIQWTATTPGTKRLMVDVMDSNGKMFGTNITITVKAAQEVSNVADQNQSLQVTDEANATQNAEDLETVEDAQKAEEIENADAVQEVGEEIPEADEAQNSEAELTPEE
ncbi:MAG: BspA family leucine-rich repeat surface protein [Acetatifactor sp.]